VRKSYGRIVHTAKLPSAIGRCDLWMLMKNLQGEEN